MKNFKEILTTKAYPNRVVLLWIAIFLFLFFSFLSDGVLFAIAYALLITGSMLLVSFIETRVLVKYFLIRGHHLVYYLLNIIMIGLFSAGFMMVQFQTIDFTQNLSPGFNPTIDDTNILLLLVVRVMIFMIVATVSTITYLQKSEKENQKINNDLKMESLDMELRYLKSQINPHFLFNALNNIYSLVYTKDGKAPDSVLKLSEMLRYVMVDCQADTIPLKKEIKFIESYIDFQLMKLEDSRNVTFEKNVMNYSLMLPPMLFQPLVENSFKHSRIENDPDGFIHFFLKQDENIIEFMAENSIKNANNTLVGTSKKSNGGIGLVNVKKRLSLYYVNDYSFETKTEDNKFTVIIKIKI